MRTIVTYVVVTHGSRAETDGAFRIVVDSASTTDPCVREKLRNDGSWTRVFQADPRAEAMVFEALTVGTPPVIVLDDDRHLDLGDLVLEPLIV
jgi:hypothetical protein